MKYTLDIVELSTVLAALRFYQEKGMGEAENRSYWLDDIATNCGDFDGLDAFSISLLCERLNMEGVTDETL